MPDVCGAQRAGGWGPGDFLTPLHTCGPYRQRRWAHPRAPAGVGGQEAVWRLTGSQLSAPHPHTQKRHRSATVLRPGGSRGQGLNQDRHWTGVQGTGHGGLADGVRLHVDAVADSPLHAGVGSPRRTPCPLRDGRESGTLLSGDGVPWNRTRETRCWLIRGNVINANGASRCRSAATPRGRLRLRLCRWSRTGAAAHRSQRIPAREPSTSWRP
ncbi:hypothetical protein AAFF_G00241580 [Aldrovandia affinis]|uniref:Uncharacterized protein n=1 Tax=Aldrovandia affinis TaxID=143900 RepID=A0AAD7WTY6_9TELE|nr:hypothetical protein AAFF_G00241580 [Aldrovandia affinis]